MAEFEGKLDLNVETAEIEIIGKFKLTEQELSKVAGGSGFTTYCYYACSSCKHYWKGPSIETATNPGISDVSISDTAQPCQHCGETGHVQSFSSSGNGEWYGDELVLIYLATHGYFE